MFWTIVVFIGVLILGGIGGGAKDEGCLGCSIVLGAIALLILIFLG